MSGDIGCCEHSPITLFYEKDTNHNVTYVACGLGESEKDAVIKVDITAQGEVTLTPISLAGAELESIEHYGIDYWTTYFSNLSEDTPESPLEQGVLDYLVYGIGKTFTNRFFWIGVFFGGVLSCIALTCVFLLRRKLSKR